MPFTNDIFSYTGGSAPGPASTTIGSAKATTRDDDVKNALNTTTSLVRGGTGGATAVQGNDNLSSVSSAIASATTTDLSAATGVHVTISGTTPITGFGTEQAGAIRYVTFSGVLTVTHNATSMICPGAVNFVTVAGSTGMVQSLGSGNWRWLAYSGYLSQFANLSDLDSASTARTNLGLAALAELATVGLAQIDIAAKKENFTISIGDETTALTTGTAKVTFRMPYGFELTEIRASLTTSSSSGLPTFDVNLNGATSTILSTKLTIDAGETTSTSAATAAVISNSTLTDNGNITIDIDNAGTGATGAKLYFIGYQT